VGEPARGYSWPPFEAGNEAGLKHGAASARRISPVAETLRAQVEQAAPWTAAAPFARVLESWAWTEARCTLYRQWFDERGLSDQDGQPLPGLVEWDRCERRAATLRDQLGLTPASLVGILARVAATTPEAMAGSLDRLRAAGAAIRAAAEARALEGGSDE
jgi:hypothetical protein